MLYFPLNTGCIMSGYVAVWEVERSTSKFLKDSSFILLTYRNFTICRFLC